MVLLVGAAIAMEYKMYNYVNIYIYIDILYIMYVSVQKIHFEFLELSNNYEWIIYNVFIKSNEVRSDMATRKISGYIDLVSLGW